LVCFDLGGVLIRICRSWREGCQAAGLPVRGTWPDGSPVASGWRELGVQFGTGRIDAQTWAHQLSKLINGLYSPQEIAAVHHAWLLGEFEGVGPVVDRIHAAGLETAALSNTNHEHWARLPEFPTVMRLHHRLASFELGLHKPDPAIYRALEARLNRRGGEIILFDDLPENIESALRCGWRAELIDPHSRTDAQIDSALRRLGALQ